MVSFISNRNEPELSPGAGFCGLRPKTDQILSALLVQAPGSAVKSAGVMTAAGWVGNGILHLNKYWAGTSASPVPVRLEGESSTQARSGLGFSSAPGKQSSPSRLAHNIKRKHPWLARGETFVVSQQTRYSSAAPEARVGKDLRFIWPAALFGVTAVCPSRLGEQLGSGWIQR